MKIDKLYTLSQFVDYINKIKAFTDRHRWILVYNYNLFLKKSLKKEMFVNSIKQKWERYKDKDIMVCDSHYDKWQEAEKKVIFEPKSLNRSGDPNNYWTIHMIARRDSGILSELAESTNGELKLKNIEI